MITALKRLVSDTNPLRLLYHHVKAWCAVLRYGFPGKKLTALCITGTDGKTTTVAMLAHILHHAGIKAGAVSTAFLIVGDERRENPSQKTSLSPFALQKFLRELVDTQCTHVIIECSSHGLVQGRLKGITPKVAAMTNISMEHLDYHKTIEAYIAAKGILFHELKGKGVKVLNADDETYNTYKDIASEKTLTYGDASHEHAEPVSFLLSDTHGSNTESSATLIAHEKSTLLTLPLAGTFNVWNAACAIACAEAADVPVETSIEALKNFKGAPGRLERIDAGQPFTVFIDFTVTPVAYEKTLSSVRAMVPEGKRLLVLTGSCGDRMKEKRPLIGKLCAEYADVVAVTNEDPYTEDPEKIMDDIFAGIPDDLPALTPEEMAHPPHRAFTARISNRREAIKFLLKHAASGDIVLFCGKGSDVTMWTKRGQIPWIERDIVREEIMKLQNGTNCRYDDDKTAAEDRDPPLPIL